MIQWSSDEAAWFHEGAGWRPGWTAWETRTVDDLTRLARLAAAGDTDALERFVSRSQADVWRLCAHLVGRQHADDASQEAYVRALRALPDFRGDSSARTWLLAITRYTCVDFVRRLSRRRALLGKLRDTTEDSVERAGTGAIELDQVMADLEPDRRSAFVLTQVLGLSYAEAAEVCGCPVGTIRSRVARAREELVGRISSPASETGPDGAISG